MRYSSRFINWTWSLAGGTILRGSGNQRRWDLVGGSRALEGWVLRNIFPHPSVSASCLPWDEDTPLSNATAAMMFCSSRWGQVIRTEPPKTVSQTTCFSLVVYIDYFDCRRVKQTYPCFLEPKETLLGCLSIFVYTIP